MPCLREEGPDMQTHPFLSVSSCREKQKVQGRKTLRNIFLVICFFNAKSTVSTLRAENLLNLTVVLPDHFCHT